MKLCKDCKFFLRDLYVTGAPRLVCVHPDHLSPPEPVEGRRTGGDPASLRMAGNRCGPDAGLWEEAPERPGGIFPW